MPVLASFSPKGGHSPDPSTLPPPCTQTSTGTGFCGCSSGVQTLRYRHASSVAIFRIPSISGSQGLGICGHAGPHLIASRTPRHLGGSCGARQRNSPTGCAANGIPKNAPPAGSSATFEPSSMPLSIVTCGPASDAIENALRVIVSHPAIHHARNTYAIDGQSPLPSAIAIVISCAPFIHPHPRANRERNQEELSAGALPALWLTCVSRSAEATGWSLLPPSGLWPRFAVGNLGDAQKQKSSLRFLRT